MLAFLGQKPERRSEREAALTYYKNAAANDTESATARDAVAADIALFLAVRSRFRGAHGEIILYSSAKNKKAACA